MKLALHSALFDVRPSSEAASTSAAKWLSVVRWQELNLVTKACDLPRPETWPSHASIIPTR